VAVAKAPYWRYMSGALYAHPHRSYGMWWDKWRATPEFQAAVPCGENHPQSQQLAVSYGLDRFPELVATGDTGRLEALFVELAGAWSSVYSEATSAIFRCLAQNHRGDRERRFPSLMAFMLRNAPWLSTTRGGAAELTPPRSTWRISSAISPYAYPFIPLLADALDRTRGAATVCEAIGVIDSARPRSEQVASILRAIAERVGLSDGKPPPRWEDAARWAMRQLDSALADGRDTAGLQGTPLLAAQGGQLLFEPAPYVSENRQLAAAWDDELPIFQGDKDLSRLISVFDLPRLDQLVRITPVIAGESKTDSARLRAALHAASPYLAALAADAQPSRVDQVRSRLRFLEVQACRDLVLRYDFDGRQREQTDPTTFLTWRVAREGAVQRRIGTAYLEVAREGGQPDWYTFGPQLAEYLEVPTQRDAFALILQSNQTARDGYVRSRGLQEQVTEERIQLEIPEPPIDEFVPLPQPTRNAGPEQPPPSVPPVTRTAPSGPSTREAPGSEVPPIVSSGLHETETLPPLDPAGIRAVDVSPALVSPPPASGAGGTGGGYGLIDWEHRERMARTYGRRGEEAALLYERSRVAALGFDAQEVVVWEADRDETAAFDIRSVDEGGDLIYIDVKATAAEEEDTPFDMTAAELTFAMRNRLRYYIYRVVGIRSSRPIILRYRDPIGAIEEGRGAIRVASAHIFLAPEHRQTSR
jgi:hypothetical protein